MGSPDGEQPKSPGGPALVVMVGVPGAGKSHLVRLLSARLPLRVIQTDELRRELFARRDYSPEESRRVFAVAHGRIAAALDRGEQVVFDATNLREWGRRTLYRMAEERGAKLLVILVTAPDGVVERRLAARQAGADPSDRSEAGWEVYLRMKSELEEISRPHLVVDSSEELDPAMDEIERLLRDQP